ncbi:peptidylprolyl isomerase [Psychrosphaera aestuarii]|uniref:peptidylprolyl isomerase n=1 Tax=Psychrosphaera aestuarii TaxID=1266052 RepID=UPI001B327A08|nr:peptidylprolyl isomerase [Psychrosphaera aestuarii]
MLQRTFGLLLLIFITLFTHFSTSANEIPRGEYIQTDNLFPKVKMVTNLGDMIIELDRSRAKITVDNFLSYVVTKKYDNTIFHRLEPEFVLQGGGYTTDIEQIKEFPEIINESGNGLKNNQFTISMARQYEPHTATSQFFFNLVDNDSLNPGKKWGYTVFGEVVEGQSVLEKAIEIGSDFSEELGWPNFPNKKIEIISVQILSE